MACIKLVHWNAEEARIRAQRLIDLGYEVDHQLPNPSELLRQLKQESLAAIVIDLARLPSQGRDLAINIRRQRVIRNLPLVFVSGQPDKVANLKGLLPDAVYTSWEGIGKALKEVIDQPPQDPVTPDSVFAAYTGKPLVQKLGIKSGVRVFLIDAPPGFKELLTGLPDNVYLQENTQAGGDMTIWFVVNHANLEREMTSIASQIRKASLWIAWPKKSSGVLSDLTQTHVRQAGLSAGLVDYKICSIDQTWSGLLFTKRKNP